VQRKTTTVQIYVVRDTPSSDYSDVGIILEGVVVLQDIEYVTLATAMLFGLFFTLKIRIRVSFVHPYPTKLRYTFEVNQKVVMELEATELSRKVQIFLKVI
uniref:Uncharacterized protein n=1 Tax=Scophthalmus maximus TaxID=52904 RepID=A0A8D3CLV4_SCOMX